MPSSSCESSEVGSIVSYSSLDDAEDEGGQKRVYVPQEKKSFKRCCCYSLFSVVVLDFTLVILFGIKSFSSDPLKQTKAKSPCSQFPADCAHTAPFVFDSLYSLLKQWPSTYAPNGHSIAAGVIPADTPLYHAQGYPGPPRKPTFYAFDAEMSVGIYGGSGISYLLTMTTTKPLTIIYLDGQSASLTRTGSLDSQTALIRGKVVTDPGNDYIFDDHQRALDLCRLATQFQIDGFVRMNAGFEALICDYSKAGIIPTFAVNISFPEPDPRKSDPSLPQDPNRPPPLGYGNTYAAQNGWEWVRSGTWHYGGHISNGGSNAERRVKLSPSGIISFYDPRLRSLHGKHHGGIVGNDTYENGWGLRKGHRLLDISEEDAENVKDWVKHAVAGLRLNLRTGQSAMIKNSGVDWQIITDLIVDKHKTRLLEIVGRLEGNARGILSDNKVTNDIHLLMHAVLYAFFEYPASANTPAEAIQENTIRQCASLYTLHLDDLRLNEFELFLRDSIQVVMDRLCSWEWKVFLWSEKWTTDKIDLFYPDTRSNDPKSGLARIRSETHEMLNWLGWDLWNDCEHKCAYNELCYIPMWPVVYSPGKPQGGIYADAISEQMDRFWKPKCIDRDEFDRGGGRARDPWHQLPDKITQPSQRSPVDRQ